MMTMMSMKIVIMMFIFITSITTTTTIIIIFIVVVIIIITIIMCHGHCNTFVLVRLRPVIQILCHVLARGWGHWLRYFIEAKVEVKYRASTWIRGPKHDTRFEWPVSILIMTRYPFLPFKTQNTSAKNPRLLTIAGAVWFCRYRHCTPSQLWMHALVAKERRLMTSQYPIFHRTDKLNPQWMQAVNG